MAGKAPFRTVSSPRLSVTSTSTCPTFSPSEQEPISTVLVGVGSAWQAHSSSPWPHTTSSRRFRAQAATICDFRTLVANGPQLWDIAGHIVLPC